MRDLFSQTWASLSANRLRTLLTMFGIAWGIASIVILTAMAEGFSRGNKAVIEELGKNIVIIRNGRTSLQAGGQRAGRVVRLELSDVHALERGATRIAAISPELMRVAVRAKSDFNSATLQMSGIWPAYQDIRTLQVDRGRLLRQGDSDEARRVLVIGSEASRLLFAERDPIGRQVMLDAVPYTVVGRIRKKFQDSNYTGQDDERLFIPYETMRRDFPLTGEYDTRDSLSAIIASSTPEAVEEARVMFDRAEGGIFRLGDRTPLENEIRAVLGPKKDFEPQDVEALSMWNTSLESIMFEKMIRAMNEFFLAVSIITLALGGIGMMNIMLIAVRERTREIGIRKALGATSRTIQWQFFSEGISMTLASGAIGFLIGAALCAVVNQLPLPERFAGMIITWQTAALAVAVLTVVGALASSYPARRAADLPPIVALRYEM